ALGSDGNENYAAGQAALERGAAGVVCRGPVRARRKQTWIEVPDVRTALGQAGSAFFGAPGDRLKMILVPGNTGHAQLAGLIRRALEGAGLKTALIGSVRHELGGRELPA